MLSLRRLAGRIDGFLAALGGAVVLALLAPALGTSRGPLALGAVTNAGIALVFFLHGASLSTERLVAGARHWRLHLFVQACIFGLFPVLGILLAWILGPHLPAALVTGFVFLTMLPSTLSSSVALTTMAGGDVAAAMFNTTLSNLLGMVLTPLLLSQWLHAAGTPLPVADAILGVTAQLLLPFVLGRLLRSRCVAWLDRHKAAAHRVDRAVVVLIVYVSFCDSAAAGLWRGASGVVVGGTLVLAVALLALALGLTRLAARRLGFVRKDEIVAVFCGSKKSLAAGIAMARLLFGARPELGLILLPVMLYHPIQLVVGAALARRYAARRPR